MGTQDLKKNSQRDEEDRASRAIEGEGVVKTYGDRMFRHPTGRLGRIGGWLMARVVTTRARAAWILDILNVQVSDVLLEIGFGPGVAVAEAARRARHVIGVDPSPVMLRIARRRNAPAITAGKVELHFGTADRLDLPDASVDKVFAMNSLPFWPDATAGLREVRRVLRPGGRFVASFTRHARWHDAKARSVVQGAGFDSTRVVKGKGIFSVVSG